MRTEFARRGITTGLVISVVAVAVGVGVSHPRAAARSEAGGPATATRRDQSDVAITVYNSNLALVRDVRHVRLESGDAALRFEDIAASINPATVHVRSLTAPATLGVVEQNYEYDLLEPQKLLQKYVGREVTLVRAREENGTTRFEETKATLLALNNGPVWRIGHEIVTGMPSDHYRFPELPENLFSHPTLLWMLHNAGPREHDLEVSYLTGGISWRADYVLTVDRDDKNAGLDGWVTLNNESGATYRDAKLQLVAGELNRVRVEKSDGLVAQEAMAMRPAAAPAFAQEAFSEYHLYTLGRRTSVGERESKQINLLDAPVVPVTKRFVVNGQSRYFRASRPGAAVKDAVEVYYRVKNAKAGGLGQPLPAGIVRVYQRDSAGSTQFIGEDRIDHTPEDETLDLHIGNAFDVVCERKQTDYRRLGDRLWEVAYEIRLRNHKAAPMRVEIERADRRRLGDAARLARVDEDGGLRGAVHGGRSRRRRDGGHVQSQNPVARGLRTIGVGRLRGGSRRLPPSADPQPARYTPGRAGGFG